MDGRITNVLNRALDRRTVVVAVAPLAIAAGLLGVRLETADANNNGKNACLNRCRDHGQNGACRRACRRRHNR